MIHALAGHFNQFDAITEANNSTLQKSIDLKNKLIKRNGQKEMKYMEKKRKRSERIKT